jgi:hypothetical protein
MNMLKREKIGDTFEQRLRRDGAIPDVQNDIEDQRIMVGV